MFFSCKISKIKLAAAACLLAVLLFMGVSHAAVQSVADVDGKAVRLPIIMYHSILPKSLATGSYLVTPEMLENDLRYLQQEGYTAVTVQDVIDYVNERAELPAKPIMITFDDGYYNNYYYAFPLMKKYEMKMVLSPIVNCTEQFSEKDGGHKTYSHVTWDQITEMAESGYVEIQNHTYNLHKSKGRLGSQKLKSENAQEYQVMLRKDITTAQTMMEEHTGIKMNAFVYPFGAVSPEALPVIRSLGFEATLTCEERMNKLTHSTECLYGLGRFLRSPKESTAAFFHRIENKK